MAHEQRIYWCQQAGQRTPMMCHAHASWPQATHLPAALDASFALDILQYGSRVHAEQALQAALALQRKVRQVKDCEGGSKLVRMGSPLCCHV